MIKKPSQKAIFVTKNTFIDLTEKSHLILSPEFYWVIKRQLPVKHLWQAKRLCPSLFDGIIPNAEYTFMAVREQKTFLLFAYDSHIIAKHIQQHISHPEWIESIYFTQTEIPKGDIYDCDENILTDKDGIFVLLPKKIFSIEESTLKKITFASPSPYKIAIQSHTSFISKKHFRFLLTFLLLLFSFNVIEALIYNHNINKIHSKEAGLYTILNMPANSWQLGALKKHFLQNHNNQLSLREDFFNILTISFQDHEMIQSLTMEKKSILLTLAGIDSKRMDFFKSELLKRKLKILDSKLLDTLWSLELKHE